MTEPKTKNAGIRFDPENYVGIEYQEDAPAVRAIIIKNGEIIEPTGDYITIEQLLNILADYVSDTDLNTALADYVTDTDLDTTLADYVTSTNLNTALADYVTDTDLNTTLADYVSDTDLNTELADYVTDTDLNTALADYVSDTDLNTELADYVTDTDLNTTLADYVTDTELQTELTDYAKLVFIDKTYTGTYTIPSAGYLKIADSPPEIGTNAIASMMIASWGANNGTVTVGRSTNNTTYLMGAAGSSLTDFTIRYLYYL